MRKNHFYIDIYTRLLKLQKEREEIEEEYRRNRTVYPDFRLSLMVRLEA